MGFVNELSHINRFGNESLLVFLENAIKIIWIRIGHITVNFVPIKIQFGYFFIFFFLWVYTTISFQLQLTQLLLTGEFQFLSSTLSIVPARGVDEICGRLLLLCEPEISDPLWIVLNCALKILNFSKLFDEFEWNKLNDFNEIRIDFHLKWI